MGRKQKCRSLEVIMQVPGSDNAGPGSDILGLELMSEGIETLLEKKKASGIMFGSNFILSEIFISEWTLSLRLSSCLSSSSFLRLFSFLRQSSFLRPSSFLRW